MKKRITILSVLLLCFAVLSNKAKAQLNYIDYATRILNCNYIFEGKVIQSTPYMNAAGTYIYTSNTIQLTKIFKGDLICGTVELITNDGKASGKEQTTSHTLHLTRGVMGIFACNITQKQLSGIDFYPENNPQKLEPTYEEQSFVSYVLEDSIIRAYDMTTVIDSLSYIYNLTDAITGIYYTNCNANNSILYEGAGARKTAIKKPINTTTRKGEFTGLTSIQKAEGESLMKISAHPRKKNNWDKSSGKSIKCNITNQIITGTGPYYCEFDVNLADDVGGVYFEQASVIFQYDTVQFGTYIVDSLNISATRGSLISNASVYYSPVPNDLTANKFSIDLPTQSGVISGFAAFPSSFTQAIHVSMEITGNCAGLGNIAFTDQNIMALNCIYDTSGTTATSNWYATALANQTIFAPSCGMHIYSISPTTINGGVFNTLSITGTGFLSAKGNGNVYFRNADNGGLNQVAADNVDYTYWSDNLIKLHVMSADSGYNSSGIWGPDIPAGSGFVSVVTDTGATDQSTQNLNIYYSIKDATFPGSSLKLRCDLGKKRGEPNSQGYLFYVDSTIWKSRDTIAIIKRALHDWTCVTGVNWEIAGVSQPDSSTAQLDHVNRIQFGHAAPGNIAETTVWPYECDSIIAFPEDIDLIINQSPTYPFMTDTTGITKPAGKSDLFFVMLHELGHAHQLIHVNDPNALMYYKTHDIDSIAGTDRKIHLFLDNSASDGGTDVMQHSILTSFSSTCPDSTLGLKSVSYCTELPVEEIKTIQTEISIYPNPATDNLTISFSSLKNENVIISVVNILGQTIKQSKLKAENKKSEISIDISDLAEGIYVCTFVSDKERKALKFIKQ